MESSASPAPCCICLTLIHILSGLAVNLCVPSPLSVIGNQPSSPSPSVWVKRFHFFNLFLFTDNHQLRGTPLTPAPGCALKLCSFAVRMQDLIPLSVTVGTFGIWVELFSDLFIYFFILDKTAWHDMHRFNVICLSSHDRGVTGCVCVCVSYKQRGSFVSFSSVLGCLLVYLSLSWPSDGGLQWSGSAAGN